MKEENPWNVQSLYDLQYFNCPSPFCIYKNNSKQKFINHVYNAHPEKIYYLKNIKDGSMDDITCPWNLKNNPHDSNDNNYGFNFENVVTKIEIENSDIEDNEDNYLKSVDVGMMMELMDVGRADVESLALRGNRLIEHPCDARMDLL